MSSPTVSFSVGDEADLNSALATIDVGGANAQANTAYTITLTGDIFLTTALQAIDLASGASITIVGSGFTINGGNSQSGFVVEDGTLSLDQLTLQDLVAQGGTGGIRGGEESGTGVYGIAGTDAAVTTAVDGLVFTPTAHQVAPGSSVTTTFTIRATDTAGETSTTTVAATAVNDPPVIGGTVAGQTTTDEAALSPFSGVSISDVDLGQTETVTITLSAAGNGTLSNLDDGSYNASTGVYSITGTDAAVTTAVDGLAFTPTAHQVAPGSSVITTFTIRATDTAGGTSSNSTTTVGVTAVNDPPVITGTVAGQLINDDQTDRPFSRVTISDPDVGASETVTITLNVDGVPSDANGTLSGAGLTETGPGTGIYTLTAGTPAAVTADLQALVFNPAVLTLPPGSAAVTDMTLSVSDGIAGSPTTDTATSVAIVPCFAACTRIATPSGSIPVERLREGDTVLTVSGRPQSIQWIGYRTLDCRRHISPERVKPIRIAPHAFGENRPHRALLLSPDHSVYVEDVLIPIKHLINGTTVMQIDVSTVTYYHVELPRHDVVLAEGLPAETYLETGARFALENGGGAMQLYPDFAPDEARVGMVWQNFSYAPLIGTDGQLDRVRARLALQALMLGHRAIGTSQRGEKASQAVMT